MTDKPNIGKLGEIEARLYISSKGLTIKHLNWHDSHRELDIVAEDDRYLIIIEVKTRTDPDIENPKEAVTIKKQKNIVRAAQSYIEVYDIDKEVRFDVVSVLLRNGKVEIEHIEDAFTPMW
jgi:putative endonuclease